jgi:hypothetical protein
MARRGRVAGAVLCVALVAGVGLTTGIHPASAQASPFRRGLGLRVTAPDQSAYRSAAFRAQSVGDPPLPASVDLTAWAPPPGDQGQVSSCVSWAIDYTAMGWYLRRHSVDGFPLAPMYTYAQLVHGHNVGTYFEDTFAIAQTQGVDDASDYTQGDYNFTSQPTAAERENAINWKLESYQPLPVGLYPTPDNVATTITAIKTALAAQTPVLLGIDVYDQFYGLSSGHSDLDLVSGQSDGGHAVTALGYDSYGVTIENSWSSGWGDNGFARLSWRFLTGQIQGHRTLQPNAFSAYALGPVDVTPATAPHVSAISAATGAATGGRQLTIVGSNFDPGSTVTFGGVASPLVQIDPSGTRIVATTPAHAPGYVTVNVSGDNGRSPTWARSLFLYVGAPHPTGVSPNRAPYRGGTRIAITGSRLNGASVMIGNMHVKVLSATSNRLVIAAPSGHRGKHAELVLANAGGSVRAATFSWT